MFTNSDTRCRYIGHHNGVNTEQFSNHQSPKAAAASFIKRLNPFSKSKSHEISSTCESSVSCGGKYKISNHHDKEFDTETATTTIGNSSNSVKVLKKFWNDQIKTTKSTEHLNDYSHSEKSATINLKQLSQSTESIYEKPKNINEKSQTLDGRSLSIVHDFNKFKDANFVRNQKNRWLRSMNSSSTIIEPEKEIVNHFPSISSIGGGKIHWTKRDEVLLSPSIRKENNNIKENQETMTTTMKQNVNNSAAKRDLSRKESISSSAGSITSTSTTSNLTNRKFSFKTSSTNRGANYTKKIATNSNSKVAQIAQRFNQIIQHDTSLLDEVKKRGTIVVHGTGGRVFKIKEEKKVESPKKSTSNDDDDNASLPSLGGGKNSTRRRSIMLKKRPSIRILVESPKKDGNGNVLNKKQLYETNVVNKETIVMKPKVPDKSERVLAKTQELRNKKQHRMETEERLPLSNIDSTADQVQSTKSKNNFQKIYDKISFRPTFLYGYGKKSSSTSVTEKPPTIAEKSAEEIVLAVKSSNKEINDTSASLATAEDDLDFTPIDLKLNVYFKDENLSSTTAKEDTNDENIENIENINSQGSITIDDDVNKTSAKPNSSFLFRSQTKLESACDVFIRDMLHVDDDNVVDVVANESAKCNEMIEENNYEIIAKVTSECDDIGAGQKEENIYQSLCEVKGGGVDNESVKSYESFENYDEIAQNILDNKISLADLMKDHEDDYILPEKAPDPPPPRKNTIPLISQPILTSTTSTLIQNEMQVPMIVPNYELKKSSSTTSSTTYEKIKYDRLPKPTSNDNKNNNDENIYDTIKHHDNVKQPKENNTIIHDNTYENAKNETMSIISNCYESISLRQNYSTINQILRNAISTTTLTSEHRINSIYGTMVGQSLTPPSDRSASDNSDDWIDLSDEENEIEHENDNNRFIV